MTGFLRGGAGDDVYVIDREMPGTAGIVENLDEGFDIIRSHVSLSLPSNVEQLILRGSADLTGQGNSANNSLIGNLGANILAGLKGDDFLNAGGGSGNLLLGGRGNDRLCATSGDNVLRGGAGDDSFLVYGGDNRLFGGVGNDDFSVGEGANLIFGGPRTDSVSFNLSSVGVTVYMGANKKNAGGAEGVRLKGIENLSGSDFDDLLAGDGGNNQLSGGFGNDTLRGGGGDDTLISSYGTDILRGGTGADTFRFELALFQDGANIRNVIADFAKGTDVIDLSSIDADRNTFGDQAFTFIGTAAFSGTAGELRSFQKGGDTRFEIDVDGDGVLDLSITLIGLVTLTADDFIL